LTDNSTTPDEIVDHARLTAQRQGKPMLGEMIAALDEEIAAKVSAVRAGVGAYGHEVFDLSGWGRKVCVLEAALAFLQRISDDPEARDYLVKRFRKEGYERVSMDRQGGRQAAQTARSGDEVR
jgi:hypothetical protein